MAQAIATVSTTNLLIMVGTILLIVGGILFYLMNRTVKVGNVEVGGRTNNLTVTIPRIDDQVKTRLQATIDGAHDLLLAYLPKDMDRRSKMLIGAKLRLPLVRAIYRNHLTIVFSSPDEYKIWLERLYNDIHASGKIMEDYCNLKDDDPLTVFINGTEFRKYIEEVIPMILDQWKPIIADGCRQKMEVYGTYKDEKSKALFDKNEGYLRRIG